MAQPFVGLCCIIRNAEKTIKTLLDSIEGVFDEVVFVDTGSTDATKRLVEEHFHLTPCSWGGEWFEERRVDQVDRPRVRLASFEWVDDFSAARNYSYSLGTAKWRCYLDADDDASDFQKKLRPTLERTDKEHPEVNCISIGYRYTTDGGMVQDKLGRIVRWDGGWEFRDPIHEHLERLPGRGGRNISKYLDMEVKHQHATQERINAGFERNVRITEKWYNTATDPKKKALAAYYLAIAAHGIDQYDVARRYFREAVDGLGRINLSAESLSRWARMELKLGNVEKAVALASESFGNDPDLPDGLSVLGATLTAAGETSRAAAIFDMLRAKPKPLLESHHDVIWLDGLVNVYAAQAYYREGRVDDAVKALNSIPKEMINHPEVHAAAHEIHNSLQKTEGFKRLQQLWEFLIWDTEPLKAKRLLEELAPAAISDSPAVKQLLAQTEKKMPQMKDWGAYQRTYAAIPELPYHVPDTHRDWTLQQGRARMVRQWAEGLPKEGPVVEVLVIGVQDGLIEGGMMEANPRIHLTACDVAPQASKGISELIERFPGRVRTHQVKEDHYDWFPSRRADYDAIILFEVIEHLPDDEKAVKLIRQYLKSDGRFFLSTPIASQWVEEYLSDMKSDRPWWHVRAHNPSSLWNLLQKVGFTGSLIGLGQESLFLGSLTPAPQPTEEISIYVYPLGAHGFDPFSPKTSHTGGSEEAVIHLSAALARQGARVTVYTDMPKRKDTTFVFNGVQWRGHPEFDVGSLKGTLLVWRAPALAANFKRANPRLKVLNWLHDTNYLL